MSTEIKDPHDAAWMRVREAVIHRWPHISPEELLQCENDADAMIQFVRHRTEAADEEVEEVVREFAPRESMMHRMADAASHQAEHASEAVRSAYQRADDCIAERPNQSVMTSFIAGLAIGAAATTLWFKSQRQPTTWQRLHHRPWS